MRYSSIGVGGCALLQQRQDRAGGGKSARFVFRMDQLAVDGDLKDAALRRDQRHGAQRAVFHAFDNFFRQPDGLWFVVSLSAVFDLNFHCTSP